jgi:microcystin-dependent protein
MLPHITAAIIDNWKSFHMLKRLCLALAGLFALASLAQAAGTVPGFSLTPQFDLTGKVAPGCKLYIIQAGTTSTPQNAYQDSGLTILQPNPMLCDAGGRISQFFVADGLIKLRLTDKNGVQLFVGDNLLVVGPSSGGGGGGGTVDPTTVMQTGHLELFYGTGVLSGFVRANGRTIGSATSGATERANADTSALFIYLWGADANLAVSGGRGASGAADFAANKTIALPDVRGRGLAGLDDMGNTAASRLSATYFGATATVLGAVGGSESTTLTATQIPAHTHPNTLTDPGHTHTYQQPTSFGASGAGAGILGSAFSSSTGNSTTGITINNAANTGGGNPHRTVQPTMLTTIYLKL